MGKTHSKLDVKEVFSKHGYRLEEESKVPDVYIVSTPKLEQKARIVVHKLKDKNHKQRMNWHSLSHPNILKLYEHFLDKKRVYFVYENCLDTRVSIYFQQVARNVAPGRAREPLGKRWTQQCLLALKHCNEVGLFIHDFNFGDVLVDENNNAKIANFDRLHRGAYKCVKVDPKMANYRCPEGLTKRFFECASRRPRSAEKAQVWAVGASLLELLADGSIAGRNFNTNDDVTKTKKKNQITKNNLSRLPEFLKGTNLTDECKGFLTESLALNPRDRPTIVAALKHNWFIKDVQDDHQTKSRSYGSLSDWNRMLSQDKFTWPKLSTTTLSCKSSFMTEYLAYDSTGKMVKDVARTHSFAEKMQDFSPPKFSSLGHVGQLPQNEFKIPVSDNSTTSTIVSLPYDPMDRQMIDVALKHSFMEYVTPPNSSTHIASFDHIAQQPHDNFKQPISDTITTVTLQAPCDPEDRLVADVTLQHSVVEDVQDVATLKSSSYEGNAHQDGQLPEDKFKMPISDPIAANTFSCPTLAAKDVTAGQTKGIIQGFSSIYISTIDCNEENPSTDAILKVTSVVASELTVDQSERCANEISSIGISTLDSNEQNVSTDTFLNGTSVDEFLSTTSTTKSMRYHSMGRQIINEAPKHSYVLDVLDVASSKSIGHVDYADQDDQVTASQSKGFVHGISSICISTLDSDERNPSTDTFPNGTSADEFLSAESMAKFDNIQQFEMGIRSADPTNPSVSDPITATSYSCTTLVVGEVTVGQIEGIVQGNSSICISTIDSNEQNTSTDTLLSGTSEVDNLSTTSTTTKSLPYSSKDRLMINVAPNCDPAATTFSCTTLMDMEVTGGQSEGFVHGFSSFCVSTLDSNEQRSPTYTFLNGTSVDEFSSVTNSKSTTKSLSSGSVDSGIINEVPQHSFVLDVKDVIPSKSRYHVPFADEDGELFPNEFSTAFSCTSLVGSEVTAGQTDFHGVSSICISALDSNDQNVSTNTFLNSSSAEEFSSAESMVKTDRIQQPEVVVRQTDPTYPIVSDQSSATTFSCTTLVGGEGTAGQSEGIVHGFTTICISTLDSNEENASTNTFRDSSSTEEFLSAESMVKTDRIQQSEVDVRPVDSPIYPEIMEKLNDLGIMMGMDSANNNCEVPRVCTIVCVENEVQSTPVVANALKRTRTTVDLSELTTNQPEPADGCLHPNEVEDGEEDFLLDLIVEESEQESLLVHQTPSQPSYSTIGGFAPTLTTIPEGEALEVYERRTPQHSNADASQSNMLVKLSNGAAIAIIVIIIICLVGYELYLRFRDA